MGKSYVIDPKGAPLNAEAYFHTVRLTHGFQI